MTDKTQPAFPTRNYDQGMTLRDWFAGRAPETPEWWWIGRECPIQPPGWTEGDGAIAWQEAEHAWRMGQMVAWRFFYADAMLEARSKGGGA